MGSATYNFDTTWYGPKLQPIFPWYGWVVVVRAIYEGLPYLLKNPILKDMKNMKSFVFPYRNKKEDMDWYGYSHHWCTMIYCRIILFKFNFLVIPLSYHLRYHHFCQLFYPPLIGGFNTLVNTAVLPFTRPSLSWTMVIILPKPLQVFMGLLQPQKFH